MKEAARLRQGEDFEKDSEMWMAEDFLRSLMPLETIASALLRPVEEKLDAPWRLAFCLSLGRTASREVLRDLLFQDDTIVDALVDRVWQGLIALGKAAKATGAGLHAKFEHDAKFTMAFATLDKFFGGLEEMIGSPDAKIRLAMEREHCCEPDSDRTFVTSNYGVETTSQVEWSFVNLNQELPPDNPIQLASGQLIDLKLRGSWPAEDPKKCTHPRRALLEQKVYETFRKINAKLTAIDEPPLIMEEFIGGRLYTGPMFMKYNCVLRGGALNMPQPDHMVQYFDAFCRGNRYVTTIHTISSAIIKLGKLTQEGTVFRGFAGGRLPKTFMEKNEFGVCGGIECAFLSTTRDKAVATQYAGAGVGTVLQMEMGMIDRGADLCDLSQYPEEREVCFGPLTSMQVMSTSAEGAILVVNIRPNINLTNTTMDRVLAKRKVMLESMCDSLLRECQRFLGTALWTSILQGKFFFLYEYLKTEKGKVDNSAMDVLKTGGADDRPSSSESGMFSTSLQSNHKIDITIKEAARRAALITQGEASAILNCIKEQLPRRLESTHDHPNTCFSEDEFFKERVAEALEVKESIRMAFGKTVLLAALELENKGGDGNAEAARRAHDIAIVLQADEHITTTVQVTADQCQQAGCLGDAVYMSHALRFRQSTALPKLGLHSRAGQLFANGGGLLRQLDRRLPGGARLARASVSSNSSATSAAAAAGVGAPGAGDAIQDLAAVFKESEQVALTFERHRSEAETVAYLKVLLTSEARHSDSARGPLAHVVSRLLQLNPLHDLSLKDSNVDAAAAEALAPGLACCRSLQTLSLSRNSGIGDSGGAAICKALAELGAQAHLRDVSLYECDLGQAAAEALAAALPELPFLQGLGLGGNPGLGDAGGAVVCKAVADLGPEAQLETLWLRSCNLGPRTAEALAGALSRLGGLRKVRLLDNPSLGDEGCATLVRGVGALEGSRRELECLDLQNSGAGSQAHAARAQLPEELQKRILL